MANKKLPTYLTREEFDKILKVTKTPHHKVAYILGFFCGMRISEIVNLRIESIDVANRNIKIENGKGGKQRYVPLPKGFGDKWLKQIPIKCGVRSLEISFKKAVARAGIVKPNIHFHSLRHSFATHAISSGMSINFVQNLLGHSNVATTGIYLRVNPVDALKHYEEKF